ncbi:MAG: rRNA maturation RNase YbeY [Anaerolineales bacterium]
MINIEIAPEFAEQVPADILESVAAGVLRLTNTEANSDISIQLTDDATLQQYNQEYMGIDAPTDVLSFSVPVDNPETGDPYLGDLLISLPTAASQAEAAGHPVVEEVKLLVVHGVLHLLGYDHATPEEKSAMWTLQDTILAELGIAARPTE